MTAKKTPAKTSAKTASRKPAAPDAIKLLTADHAEVKKLFKDYDKLAEDGAEAAERQPLAELICTLLTVHASIEEDIFYPAAREVLEAEELDLVDEADVEHASAKDLIAQIRAASPDDDHYDARVKVLGEYIDHHVKEEQSELFPAVKKAGLDVKAIGEALAERKETLMAEMGEGMEVA